MKFFLKKTAAASIPAIVMLTALFILLALLAACGAGENGSAPAAGEASASEEGSAPDAGSRRPVLRIAEQYGLAYAPLQVMRLKDYLEEELPAYRIDWQRLGNTAAIREAMLAGRLDVGFMGIPPFLIGYDRGMEWKIFTGLSEAPLGLVTWKEEIRNLTDFGPEDRIALPQPGSIQHILLTMACERELGSAAALDDNLITMNHPDGMQALLSRRDISAHFTSPPYLMEELSAPGMRQVLSGTEAMGGEFTFIVGAALDRLLRKDPEAAAALRRALDRSEAFLRDEPEEAVALLAGEYGIDEQSLRAYLDWPGLSYGRSLKGLEEFISFMRASGYLERDFESRDLVEEVK
jgi:NitT/TauT family transport system substrate-binding protein